MLTVQRLKPSERRIDRQLIARIFGALNVSNINATTVNEECPIVQNFAVCYIVD